MRGLNIHDRNSTWLSKKMIAKNYKWEGVIGHEPIEEVICFCRDMPSSARAYTK